MRILANICAADLARSKAFYGELLELTVQYDSDWYVQLATPGEAPSEYGLIQRDHELVPEAYRRPPTGMYMTFVVDDVDAAYQRALAMDAPILQAPRDEFYGQRRFLTQDPDGCLLDISAPSSSAPA